MKLMIATPTHSGKVVGPYAIGLADVGATYPGTQMFMLPGMPYVDHARNLLVKHFLSTDCDTLFFIDDDIDFNIIDLNKIVEAPKDKLIVGGFYPVKKPGAIEFRFMVDETNRDNKCEGPYLKVKGPPTGFLMIRREVFDKLPPTWMYDDDDTTDIPRYFYLSLGRRPGYPDQRMKVGEDTGFGIDAWNVGIPSWMDTRVSLGHIGPHTWRAPSGKV